VPTVHQLEARIDEALVIARASEEGVREVGELALDAAKQARRAAEAAEQSAQAAAAVAERSDSNADVSGPAGPVADLVPPPLSGRSPKSAPPPGRDAEGEASSTEAEASLAEAASAPRPRFEVRFRSFTERADRVSARLRQLGAHPAYAPSPSVAAGRRRGDY